MEQETIIIQTGKHSSCLKETKFCGDPKTDCVSVHVSHPETVTVFEGHPKLYTESDMKAERLAGQDEGWALAQKILELPGLGGYSVDELREIFEDSCYYSITELIRGHSFYEVMTKIQKWEEKKADQARTFHVGDVVKLRYDGEDDRLGVVTWTKPGSELLSILLDDGNVNEIFKNECVKIGKLVDAAGLLDKIKEEKEEKDG